MDLELKDNAALVTGATGGLGRAVVEALQAEGANVVATNRQAPTDLLGDAFIPCDLSDATATEQLHAQATQAIGPIDLLVQCAAVWPTRFVAEMSLDEWQRTIQINLTSAFVLSRDFVRSCQADGRRGAIVHVVSQAAFGGATSGHAHYAAAKAALVNFTRSLAREVAADHIRVNALAPGMMETPMAADALADRRETYLKRIPMGRIAEPAEVADVATFLCSPRAGYITGACVDVSGGMLMH
jgi:3-oxoacyl-[acyl-carrier protein] reductase